MPKRKSDHRDSVHRVSDLRKAFVATLPVMTGYLVLGMGFGVVLRAKGYGVLWALAMSVCIYAGSMQYATLDLMTGGASLLTAALTALAVNARHLFYGISMVERYRHARAKVLLMLTLTDENYSLLCDDNALPDVQNRERYYLYVSLLNYLYWIVGSAVGNLLGAVLPFSTEGIDFALTALFLTIFVEQWLHTKNHIPALIGVGSGLVCLLCFGADGFLIPTMVCIALSLTLLRRKLAPEGEETT